MKGSASTHRVARIAVLYVGIAVLWALGPDTLLALILHDPAHLAAAHREPLSVAMTGGLF